MYKPSMMVLGLAFLSLSGYSQQGHTIFIPHSVTHNAVYELAFSNYDFYHAKQSHDECGLFDLYLTPLYQQSFNESKNAPYYLLNGKECITFDQAGCADVNPLWLDLVSGDDTNYRSKVSVDPRQSIYGMHVALFAHLDRLCSGLWTAFACAPIGIRHAIHLQENNPDGAVGIVPGITNAIDALTNQQLQSNRFNRCSMVASGLDDIQLKLGWNHYSRDNEQHGGLYLVGTIPTGDKRCNRYVFQPHVGTRNGAFGFGINGDAIVRRSSRWGDVHYMTDLKYRYLFTANERRSFDLCINGPWSRYLQVVSADQPSNPVSGSAGCFIARARVTPRSQVEWWNALHMNKARHHVECGWNLWVRQAEKIRLCGARCDKGIYDLGADAQRQNAHHEQVRQPISASRATISQSVFPPCAVISDTAFTSIGEFNIGSGAQPTSISNTLYAAYSYDATLGNTPTFFGLGFSLELGTKAQAFSSWSIWGKWGLDL